MAEVSLTAEVRREQGSAASRRLRSAGKIPGVLYGHGIEPTALSVAARDLRLALNTDAGLNALIQLDVEGTKHLALSRVVQKHPVRNTVVHVDFQIVSRDEKMDVEVPLQFIGEATAVVKNGGVVEHLLTSLSVTATPSDIPAHIDVDISELQLDDSIRVKDLPLPRGVITSLDPEEPVVVGKITRGAVSSGEGESAEGEVAAES